MHFIIFQKGVANFEIAQNMLIFGQGCSFPLKQIRNVQKVRADADAAAAAFKKW